MKFCSLTSLAVACILSAIAIAEHPPDLYYMLPSPPCRIVTMTAKVLNVDMNMMHIDPRKGEHLTPEFLKINPQHTIPALTHDGLMMSESRAIAAYLANSRPAGEKIYSKDPKKRAVIDQMLYFDMGTLAQRSKDLYRPMLMGGAPYDEEKGRSLDEAVGMLEEYLTRNEWAAGPTMTLADISLLATVSTLEAVGHDFTKYPRVLAWLEKSKKMIPDYQSANADGLDLWKEFMEKYKKEHPM